MSDKKAHLTNDNLAIVLECPSPGRFAPGLSPGGEAASTASGEGDWKLVIEATMFMTGALANVWTGIKQAGNDPTGVYARITGCDPTATLTVEAQ